MTSPVLSDHKPMLAHWRAIVCANMRARRIALGLSQGAAAAEIGMDVAHWSANERGVHNFTLLTIARIAQALRCHPSELFADRVTAGHNCEHNLDTRASGSS